MNPNQPENKIETTKTPQNPKNDSKKIEKELQYIIMNYFSTINPSLASRIGLETSIYFDSNYIRELILSDKLFELHDLLTDFIINNSNISNISINSNVQNNTNNSTIENNNNQNNMNKIDENELFALFELRSFIIKRALHQNDISIASKYFTIVEEMKSYQNVELKKKISGMIRMFSLTNEKYKEQIIEFRNHDEIRKTILCENVIELLEKSERIKELQILPKMIPHSLKSLVSNGMRYFHVKMCGGHVNEPIEIVSLLSREHSCERQKNGLKKSLNDSGSLHNSTNLSQKHFGGDKYQSMKKNQSNEMEICNRENENNRNINNNLNTNTNITNEMNNRFIQKKDIQINNPNHSLFSILSMKLDESILLLQLNKDTLVGFDFLLNQWKFRYQIPNIKNYVFKYPFVALSNDNNLFVFDIEKDNRNCFFTTQLKDIKSLAFIDNINKLLVCTIPKSYIIDFSNGSNEHELNNVSHVIQINDNSKTFGIISGTKIIIQKLLSNVINNDNKNTMTQIIKEFDCKERIKEVIDNKIVVLESNNFVILPNNIEEQMNITIKRDNYKLITANKKYLFVEKENMIKWYEWKTMNESGHVLNEQNGLCTTDISDDSNVLFIYHQNLLTVYEKLIETNLFDLSDAIYSTEIKSYEFIKDYKQSQKENKMEFESEKVQNEKQIIENLEPLKRSPEEKQIEISIPKVQTLEEKHIDIVETNNMIISNPLNNNDIDNIERNKTKSNEILPVYSNILNNEEIIVINDVNDDYTNNNQNNANEQQQIENKRIITFKENGKLLTVPDKIQKFAIVGKRNNISIMTSTHHCYFFKIVQNSAVRINKLQQTLPDTQVEQISEYGPFVHLTRNSRFAVYIRQQAIELLKVEAGSLLIRHENIPQSTISCLMLFPMESNSILIGCENGEIHLYQANKKFNHIGLNEILNQPIIDFVFFNTSNKDENPTRFFCIYEQGIVEEVRFNKTSNSFERNEWKIEMKTQKVLGGFIDEQNKMLYVYSKYTIYQIEIETKEIKSIKIENEIVKVCMNHCSSQIVGITVSGELFYIDPLSFTTDGKMNIELPVYIKNVVWIEPFDDDTFILCGNNNEIWMFGVDMKK